MIRGAFLLPHPPVVIPEIGKGSELECQNTIDGIKTVMENIKMIGPETIIIISPHGPVFSDGIAISSNEKLSGNFQSFGSKDISIEALNDLELVKEIVGISFENGIMMAEIDDNSAMDFNVSSDLDHGAMVPLYFLDGIKCNIVHITYGLLTHEGLYKFGQCVNKAVDLMGREVVVIASGDLSHKLSDQGPYEFDENGPIYDALLIKGMLDKDVVEIFSLDPQIEKTAGECGRRSIDIMLGCIDGYNFQTKQYSYEAPFGVGYAVIGFEKIIEDGERSFYEVLAEERKTRLERRRQNEDIYVKYARSVVEHYVRYNEKIDSSPVMPEEMTEKRAGVFVSLKTNQGLRGCIGTIGATEACIADEIQRNAIKACSEDPRFPGIEVEELEELMITVDVLEKPEIIEDKSQLDPMQYGIIVSKDYKRGVLLPNLEGIDTVDEQIRIVLNKAGIDEKEAYSMERFLVVRHY